MVKHRVKVWDSMREFDIYMVAMRRAHREANMTEARICKRTGRDDPAWYARQARIANRDVISALQSLRSRGEQP
jgi:hypothetical protein